VDEVQGRQIGSREYLPALFVDSFADYQQSHAIQQTGVADRRQPKGTPFCISILRTAHDPAAICRPIGL
jgi:hypothetical protein